MADNVLILEPGDERSQKIARAMTSPLAGDILQFLADGPKSLTAITEKLQIPMNTAKYHVGNLLDAGVIAVADTKYSIKGREVKLYSLTDQLLIVAPRRADVRSLLLKYASLFGIVALSTLAVATILPMLSTPVMNAELVSLKAAPAPAVDTATGAGREAGAVALQSTFGTASATAPSAFDPALAFFIGGLFVILVLLCYEAWLWKKTR